MPVKFDDHSPEVKAKLEQNVKAALHAIGQKGVELTLGQMQSGYGKPIRQTGDLMRDVQYDMRGENTVAIGNSLEYAPFVHEGYAGHAVYMGETIGFRVLPGGHTAGRPYLRDAIMGGRGAIQSIAEQYLKQGF